MVNLSSTSTPRSLSTELFSAIYSFTVGEGIPLSFRAPRTFQMPGAYILPTVELEKIYSEEEQLKKSFPIRRTAFYNLM